MSTLSFRNVEAEAEDPVESWPYEALITAIERGGVREWARIASAIDAEPWGDVARHVGHYLTYAHPYGAAPLLQRVIARSRDRVEQHERAVVAAEVGRLIDETGLSMERVAYRIGTSRSRLSTYRSGTVTPSATTLVRLRELVSRITGQ